MSPSCINNKKIDSVPWYGCYDFIMEKITIGKLAVMAGVGVETIRFYQRKELLREPKAVSGFRTYNEEDAQRIIFIKRAQDLGFTLNEVKDLLELNTKPRMTCGAVKVKTTEKIKEIEKKIADLNRMKDSLGKLAYACDASQDNVKQYKVQECFEIGLNCKC
jgi:MerR family transcriptional regulator, mercuric resistance operon regulatory protein